MDFIHVISCLRRNIFKYVFLGLLFLSGCGSYGGANAKQKEDSFSEFSGTTISGEPIGVFINKRIVRISDNIKLASVHPTSEGKLRGTYRGSPIGYAVAVSEYGHYLTVAHNLQDVNSVFIKHDDWEKPEKAQVLWISKDIDWAVVKSNAKTECFFSLSNVLPNVNAPVILGGYHGGNSAGVVLAVETAPMDNTSHAIIYHSCPISAGDSGGPLISLDGKLLAVNHSSRQKKHGFIRQSTYSMGTAVNREWLQ